MTEAEEITNKARKAFKTGKTKDATWRLDQLKALHAMVKENEDDLCKAMYEDNKKPRNDALNGDVVFVLSAAANAINNVKKWMAPTYPSKKFFQTTDTLYVIKQPLGVVLIIGPWNFPLQLTLCPLVGAIAAGNCAIVKLPEATKNTSDLLEKLIKKYLDNDCIHTYQGGPEETTEILKQKMDHIFFTGSCEVGKIVMRAATEHLTPVTLELGGRSPTYIHKNSHLDIVCNRVSFGKNFNGGQICVAPDYVLCDESIIDEYVEKTCVLLRKWYREGTKSDSMCHIINDRHFNRIKSAIEAYPEGSVKLMGHVDESDNYIGPTVVQLKSMDETYQGEMFGPVLQVVPVKSEDEAIEIINSNEHPLSLYAFSNDKNVVEKVLHQTQSGGVTINDTLLHQVSLNLPFGGVGHSGMGRYHGKYSFDCFTHLRSVYYRGQNMEKLTEARYPPYTESNTNRVYWLLSERVGGSCAIM